MLLARPHHRLLLAAMFAVAIPLFFGTAKANEFERYSRYNSEAEAVINHDVWDLFLEKHVYKATNGVNFVDYQLAKNESLDSLNGYLETLSHLDITKHNKPEQMAYWINLYNALTVKTVLDAYPVESIKEIDGGFFNRGPWKDKRITVLELELSLDDIEHEILRAFHTDPRIHYAVNCASIGCPDLAISAYKGVILEEQLTQSAEAFINHPRGAEVDDGELFLSSIFSWYADDFGKNEKEIIDHIRQFASSDLKARLASIKEITDYDYNWQINGR
jgi:hypothetical protein